MYVLDMIAGLATVLAVGDPAKDLANFAEPFLYLMLSCAAITFLFKRRFMLAVASISLAIFCFSVIFHPEWITGLQSSFAADAVQAWNS